MTVLAADTLIGRSRIDPLWSFAAAIENIRPTTLLSDWTDEISTALVGSSSSPLLGRRGRYVSKHEHLERVLNRLVEIVAESNPVDPIVVMETYQAVEAMVFDNSPTPRIAYVGDGALEIEWLVGGRSLFISCSREEGVEAWATGADGESIFEGEALPLQRFLSSTWKNQGLKLLKSMSRELRSQSSGLPTVSMLAG